uniref:Myb/SANT-like DNA-binding domain-containing protein n=1 Tax=Anthurium amnicola TaxID=1678845 RepID=A0A1D1XF92_9ARAE
MAGKEEDAAAVGVARPPNPALPYREDCWSEGATSTLIDAWGERFVELNRGNLRQKHWQEVADVVNSRRTAVRRPLRTDIQCKNRIDTLKKKYKVERARIAGSAASQWPFYDRLEELVGSSAPFSQKESPPPPPLALPLPFRKSSPLPAAAAARPSSTAKEKRHSLAAPVEDSSFVKRKYSAVAAAAAAAAAHKAEEAESGSSKSSTERSARGGGGGGWRASNEGNAGDGVGDDAEGVRELARAILRFGEIYERVEAAKQQQLLELEKQRMEFVKGLEFQRMQIFVDSQVQLEKLKRAKRATSDGYS